MEIKNQKTEERKRFLEMRRAIPPEERKTLDALVCKSIIESASFRYADIILSYSPVNFEIDITEVIAEAYRRGKRVAFPKCYAPGQMSFHFCDSIDDLSPGFRDIPEPDQSREKYCGEAGALCLVPGLVFDRHGYRIGYGGGYYDRFLSGFVGGSMGIIYKDFILDRVSKSRYDRTVDAIVCEEGIIIPR